MKVSKPSEITSWLGNALLQFVPKRRKSQTNGNNQCVDRYRNDEYIIEFIYAREGYPVHAIASYITNNETFIICGSRVGGLKVINGFTGIPIVENTHLTSANVLTIYDGDDAFVMSCGRESSIPFWSISSSGGCKFKSSLSNHSNAVNVIDTIYATTMCRGHITSRTNYLASGGDDYKVIIWQLVDKHWDAIGAFHEHHHNITQVKFVMLGHDVMIVSADHDGTIHIWNIFDQSIYFTYKIHGHVNSMDVSYQRHHQSAMLALSDRSGNIIVIDITKKVLLYTLFNNCYQEFIRSVIIYDNEEDRWLIGGFDNGSLIFCSLDSGIFMHRIYHAHRSWVSSLHVTDGISPLLVTGGCDSKVKCWDLLTITRNIRYERRKYFLMFLVGCHFMHQYKEECKDESDDQHHDPINRLCHDITSEYDVAKHVDGRRYVNIVFGSQDLCSMIARYL